MEEAQLFLKNTPISIGREISMLRNGLMINQENFANLLLVSRGTVSKMENATKMEDIPDDVVFRLFYVTHKVCQNPYKEPYIKLIAQSLYEKLDHSIQKRMNIL